MASDETVLVENARSRMYLMLIHFNWNSFETAFSTGTVSFEAIVIVLVSGE